MMRKILLGSLLVLGGCGTLFSGMTQTVTFNSNIEDTALSKCKVEQLKY